MKKEFSSVQEFLDAISPCVKGYLKKPRGTSKIILWWEDDERWFCNCQHWSPRYKDEKSTWMIAPDLKEWVEAMKRSGYQMFIEE
jgi:hypothetical protein